MTPDTTDSEIEKTTKHVQRPTTIDALMTTLLSFGFEDSDILFEFQLPNSTARADLIICGSDPQTGEPSYMVVEFKKHGALSAHDQARAYRDYLRWFLKPTNGSAVARVSALVFDPATSMSHADHLPDHDHLRKETLTSAPDLQSGSTEEIPLISSDRFEEMRQFLENRIDPNAADSAIGQLCAVSRRTKDVSSDLLPAILGGNEDVVLLDEQRTVAAVVRDLVTGRESNREGLVVIIEGAAGTGKSMIALSLIREFTEQHLAVAYSSGSKTFATWLRQRVDGRSIPTKSLFRYHHSFQDVSSSSLDALICDDAQKIQPSSASRYTSRDRLNNRAQVDELVAAARISVFLLDPEQRIRPGEVGSAELLERAARQCGRGVAKLRLGTRFGAGSSAAFNTWVDRLLDDRATPLPWPGDPGRREVTLADSPDELEEILAQQAACGELARITAGFCWPWSEPNNGHLVDDVKIGTWQRPWHVRGERAVDGAPPVRHWTRSERGFGQIGSVYAVQGQEFGWCGVILGPDLVRRGSRWVSVRSASRDVAVTKSKSEAEFRSYVLNAYRILLTRAQRGLVLYSVDAETQAFFSSIIT